MTPAIPRRLKVKASRRALKMLADQAIGHDLLKGFLELLTNSDESYARQDHKGEPGSGRIEIEIDRRPRKKQTVVRVIDWAEGMDDTQMERCVGSYGEDTSGKIGRGIFGMGLKDTINAFGEGTVTSFKEGKRYSCRLSNVEDLELDHPRLSNAADKKEHRNHAGGTTIEILVTNPRVVIPQLDSLRQQLQTHVALRGLMTDPERQVILRDLRSGSADELRYTVPDGEIVVSEQVLAIPSFPEIRPVITVKRATGADVLSQSGSYRTGGVLITSRRTIHEATLFGFDEDPHAARLFGELNCDEIYDLQALGEPIVDKNRNGLKKDHQLTRELYEAGRKVIEGIVAEEKAKEREKKESLEKEDTLRRFRQAIKNLNEIARKELQLGGLGPGGGPQGLGDMKPPVDGFEFIPDSYRVVLAERDVLKLRVQVDGSTGIAVGDKIEVTCDNPQIRILDSVAAVPRLSHEDPPLAVVSIRVEGLQANAQGFVTAKHGPRTAIAVVEVVSTKVQKQHSPSGGLFKDIKYEEWKDVPIRARFDKKEGVIFINTSGPSVGLYFGPRGEGQEHAPNQVLVAELVTELACQEIARVKRETKILDTPPGVDELDAFSAHLTKLKADYAPIIHRVLVDSQHRRPE